MSDMEKKEILGKEKDLETDELDEVAGGKACACVIGGGGEADAAAGETTCGCVVAGSGGYQKDTVEYRAMKSRCVCPFVGGGTAGSTSIDEFFNAKNN